MLTLDRLDLNKTIEVGKWSIRGGGRLERFYCMCVHTDLYTHICTWIYVKGKKGKFV